MPIGDLLEAIDDRGHFGGDVGNATAGDHFEVEAAGAFDVARQGGEQGANMLRRLALLLAPSRRAQLIGRVGMVRQAFRRACPIAFTGLAAMALYGLIDDATAGDIPSWATRSSNRACGKTLKVRACFARFLSMPCDLRVGRKSRGVFNTPRESAPLVEPDGPPLLGDHFAEPARCTHSQLDGVGLKVAVLGLTRIGGHRDGEVAECPSPRRRLWLRQGLGRPRRIS